MNNQRILDKMHLMWNDRYGRNDNLHYFKATCIDDLEGRFLVEVGRMFNSYLASESIKVEFYEYQLTDMGALIDKLYSAIKKMESFSDIIC